MKLWVYHSIFGAAKEQAACNDRDYFYERKVIAAVDGYTGFCSQCSQMYLPESATEVFWGPTETGSLNREDKSSSPVILSLMV